MIKLVTKVYNPLRAQHTVSGEPRITAKFTAPRHLAVIHLFSRGFSTTKYLERVLENQNEFDFITRVTMMCTED